MRSPARATSARLGAGARPNAGRGWAPWPLPSISSTALVSSPAANAANARATVLVPSPGRAARNCSTTGWSDVRSASML